MADVDSMVDNEDSSLYYRCGSGEAISLINQALCVPYTQRPIQERFLRAMEIGPFAVDYKSFYAVLGTHDIEQVVDLQHAKHGTLIHRAAKGMGCSVFSSMFYHIHERDMLNEWHEWLSIMSKAIFAGASLHALLPNEEDCVDCFQPMPLLTFLREVSGAVRSNSHLCSLVRKWAAGIAEAGVDLMLYGQQELAIWRQLPPDCQLLNFASYWMSWSFCITDLIIGPAASDWAVESHTRVGLWRDMPFALPCAWETENRMPDHWYGPNTNLIEPVYGKWVLERWVMLKEPAKDPARTKLDICT